MKDEKITADEALRRGYEWIQCGYNHALNKPIIGSIRQLKPFLGKQISVSALDKIRDSMATEKPPEYVVHVDD